MGDVSIEMKIPLDDNGFLQRECPNCERQFRLKPLNEEITEDIITESYYCPYCYTSASVDSWWTKKQLEYAQQLAFQTVLEPELKDLQRQIQSLNGESDFLKTNVELIDIPKTNLSSEIEDMVKVGFPCHLEEPLKIDETWEQEVACIICGIQYPLTLIKEVIE